MKKGFFAIAAALLLAGVYSFVPVNKGTADTYTINPERSKVEWSGSAKDHSHPGYLPVKSGSVSVDGGKLVGGTFVIDVAGVKVTDAAGEKLEGHLKTPDFLNTAAFPEATFTIGSVAYTGATTADITGTLKFKGVDVPVKFPAYIRAADEKGFFAEAFFSIDKNLLGIGFKGASDDIHLSIHIAAKK